MVADEKEEKEAEMETGKKKLSFSYEMYTQTQNRAQNCFFVLDSSQVALMAKYCKISKGFS